MRKLTLATLIAAVFPGLSCAADAQPASPHTVTANIGVYSNYIFRGLGQTWDRPALQGGVDYAHADGWYAGIWGSNVTNKMYAGDSLEIDYYAGYNGKIDDDWGWTAGFFGWYYPDANYNKFSPAVASYGSQDFNNQELNVGLSYKWLSAKFSYAITDYFGANAKSGYAGSTKGTTYLDVNANLPLPEETFGKDVVLALHYGRTHYAANLAGSNLNPSYNDYKVAVSKTFEGNWVVSVGYNYADNGAVYNNLMAANNPLDTRNLAGGHWVVSLVKNF